jgi:ATP-dependent RNA helicase DeaD
MRELRRYLPRERRSWMFSATMPYKVQSLASEFLHKPEFLSLSAGSESVSTAEHRFCVVPPMEKDIMLMRLIEIENPESAIIFCNMKTEVEFLAAALQNNGYSAEPLSGDLDQKARERAMSRIRRREIRFLVATDVAARGIDISDLSHVFQHDVPKDPEIYVHRAGRTARAGNTGVVITLVANMSEKSDLKKITRKYSVDFVEFTVPTEEEVEQRVVERLTVLLEDRYRLTTRNERDRMKRFEGLAKSLAENDDERVLLTMLLDEVYHNEFHVVAPPAQAAEPEPQPKPRSQPQPQPQSQPRAETQPRGGEGQPQSGDAPDNGGEGGEKKKKKRRRRPRGRKEGGEQEGVAQEGGEQEAGEQEGSEQEGSTQEVGGQEGE